MKNSPVQGLHFLKNKVNYFGRVKACIEPRCQYSELSALLPLAVRLRGHHSADHCLHFLSSKTGMTISDKFIYLRYIVQCVIHMYKAASEHQFYCNYELFCRF